VEKSGAVYTPFRAGAHISLPRVAGHRDGDSTSCPGDALYHRLPAIRPRIIALAGTPAELTITPLPAPVPPGSQVTVSGQLSLLTGAPLAGAPIELQQPAARGAPAVTFATTTTASDGSWSAAVVASEQDTAVRALHRPYPAAVADWSLIQVAPTITLQLESPSPLVVGGTISPPMRRVTIYLYSGSSPSGQPLARKRVRVIQGAFNAQLSVPGPGTYVVLARSRGTPNNAAGTSAPLTVTVT
jgi:hypothetical protein